MTNITQEQIDNLKKIYTMIGQTRLFECELCGYTSHDENNFHDGICLPCCRIHNIDY